MASGPRGNGAPSSVGRLVGLEALRFLAAFGVLVWHYQHFLFADGVLATPPANQPFRAVLAPFQTYGYAGVELFWCLSGFIFAWKYAAAVHAGGVSFARFMVLRFSRLYPLHVATLLLVAAEQWLWFQRHGAYFVYSLNDLKHFLLNLAFANFWGFQDGYSFNGPSWSVSAEILVYVLFFGLSRLIRPGLWPAAAIVVGISVLAAALRTAFGLKSAVAGAATFFYLGVVACHLHAAIEARPAARRALIGLLLLAVSLVCALLVYWGVLKIAGASIVLFPALVLLFQRAIPDGRAAVNARLGFLGDLTYASYMIHFPLQLAILLLLEGLGLDIRRLFPSPWFFLAYIAGVFGLAALVFRTFERPAQEAMRRALLGRPPPREGREGAGAVPPRAGGPRCAMSLGPTLSVPPPGDRP